jgi:hypothetical protein
LAGDFTIKLLAKLAEKKRDFGVDHPGGGRIGN